MRVATDRALIQHTYSKPDEPNASAILKVLPFSWFYNGYDRFAESIHLKKFAAMAAATSGMTGNASKLKSGYCALPA